MSLDPANKRVSFVALTQVSQSEAQEISIDDLGACQTPKGLKGKMSLSSLMKDSNHAMPVVLESPSDSIASLDLANACTKHFSLDSLLQQQPTVACNSGDEDSTIVSLGAASIHQYSVLERAVHDAFKEAIHEAVSQHTQSISNAAASNLMQKLLEG